MKNFSYKNHFRAVMPFFKLYPLKQDLFYANKHKKSSLFCIFAKGMIHNYIYYEKVAFRKKIKLFYLVCLAISNLIQILFFLPIKSSLFDRYNLCQPKSSLDTCLNLFDQRRITFQKPADIFTGDTTSQHIGNDGPDLSFTVLLF